MTSKDLRTVEDVISEAVSHIRERLSNETDRNEVLFKIQAHGRVNEGDFSITFHLENAYDSKCNIEGGNLQAVIDEYIRRNAWQDRNAPLCLPKVTTKLVEPPEGVEFVRLTGDPEELHNTIAKAVSEDKDEIPSNVA